MSKWRKVSPDQIKAGDLVKVRHVSDAYEETTSAVATNVTDLEIGVGPYSLYKDKGTWYIAKPKKAKPELSPTEKAWFTMPTISEPYTPPFPPPTRPDEPPVGSFFAVLAASINEVPDEPSPPTRPDEPPVGSFFRVDRTGREFYRYPQVSLTHYFHLACDAGDRPWVAWADVTEPGDTITLLELTEKGDKKDGGV